MGYQKIGFKNGNVLTAEQLIHMEDGIIEAGKKAPSGGGASLPAAAPYQQLVTDGEGKWGTADRLAWKEERIEEIFPEQTLEFAESKEGGYASAIEPAVFNLTIGEKNIVVWDGTKYECVAKDDGHGNAYIGNFSILGAPDAPDATDEPFFIVAVGNSLNLFQTSSSLETHTISISRIAEDVHRIPVEYLPRMPFCINVIPNDGDGAAYVADKSYAEVKEAEMQKRPIVGTFKHTNGNVYTLIGCDASANICFFVAFDVSSDIRLFKLVLFEDVVNVVEVQEYSLSATQPV